MTDYHPLISRAVEGLERSTGEARRALYERARTALVTQLRARRPAAVGIGNHQGTPGAGRRDPQGRGRSGAQGARRAARARRAAAAAASVRPPTADAPSRGAPSRAAGETRCASTPAETCNAAPRAARRARASGC